MPYKLLKVFVLFIALIILSQIFETIMLRVNKMKQNARGFL